MISSILLSLVVSFATPASLPMDKTLDQTEHHQELGKTAAPGATAPKDGDEVAVIETNLGRIVLKFFPEVAPGHVKNFKDLAEKKYYDGIKFHRVIPDFMIQGGDPNTKTENRSTYGQGGPGYQIKGEMNKTPHTRGVLSMARTSDPNSGGSQFFITVKDVPFLNPTFDANGKPAKGREGYTVFGQVIEGMDVVDKIVKLPRDEQDDPLIGHEAVMKTVRIEKWPLTKKD